MKSLVGSQLARNAAIAGINSVLANSGVFTGPMTNPTLGKGWEAITQPIYDYHAYATTGATQLQFFQQAQGNGGTTAADTNMPGSGFFPRGQLFLVDGLEVDFIPGDPPVMSQDNSAAALTTGELNDSYKVLRGKTFLSLTVGTRPYLNVGPLTQFPPSFRLTGVGALSDTTTAGPAQLTKIDLATVTGDPFQIIPYLLQETVNFIITLNWPVAIPVTTAGRIGVVMNGVLFRRNQ